MSLKEISKQYFKMFSNKDLIGLEKIFTKDITLRDWEIEAKGKKEVMKANSNIFRNGGNLLVNPLRLYEDDNTVIAELEIVVNDEKRLLVVDVIQFDSENKIRSIRAYKG